MSRFPLACLVALSTILPASARAALLTQTPTSFGTQSTLFLTPNATPTLGLGMLAAGNDGRYPASMSNAATKFAIGTALPVGATITSAILSFTADYAFAPTGGSGPLTLAVSGSKSSTTTLSLADFGTETGNAGTVSVPQIQLGGTPISFSLDVTALVAATYATGSNAVLFQYDNLTLQTTVDLAPFQGAGSAPTLSIQFTPAAVPEPASALLLIAGVGLGIGGFAASRRDRTKCPE